MGVLNVDAYGHLASPPGAAQLVGAAVGVTTAGTISGTTSAGAAPTISAVNAIDDNGTFTLNPVTGGGGQAAGIVCNVNFVQSYSSPPRVVEVTMTDVTTATAPVVVAAFPVTVTSSGFQIETTILTTAHNYLVQYVVHASA